MTLFRRDLDVWDSGEVTGTFRGSQLGFVGARVVLTYWQDSSFLRHLEGIGQRLAGFGRDLGNAHPDLVIRGRGPLIGIDFTAAGGADAAEQARRNCFREGLLIESCGRREEVLKVMPPLTVESDRLQEGLEILASAIDSAQGDRQ